MSYILRTHLTIALLLLASQAWLGVGLFGTGIGIVATVVLVVRAIKPRAARRELLQAAAVYALLFAATMLILSENWRLAQHRAAPVIRAMTRYKADHGDYPRGLDELVPLYLPSIPPAGATLMSRRFGYDSVKPQLYFPAMFHGVVAYDLPTSSWTTNE